MFVTRAILSFCYSTCHTIQLGSCRNKHNMRNQSYLKSIYSLSLKSTTVELLWMSHIGNINYSNMAPSFQDKISNLISFLCFSLLKRLDTKRSNTKYRRLSWKQLSHVRIMLKYWCIERGLLQRKLCPPNEIVLEVRVGTHWGRKWCLDSLLVSFSFYCKDLSLDQFVNGRNQTLRRTSP